MRAADARFLLPRPPASVVVLGPLAAWRDALAAAGVPEGGPPDLAVAPASQADRALRTGAEMIILEGAGGLRDLRRSGMAVRRYLALPRPDRPTAFVPVGDRHALALWRALGSARTLRRRAARAVVAASAASGRLVPGLASVTVAARFDGPPFALAGAGTPDVFDPPRWLLVPGADSADHKRNVFRVPSTSVRPGVVVKVSRLPGERTASDRDEAGLRLVESYGPVVAAHAPRALARIEVGGFDIHVQTDAGREPLAALLGSRRPRRQKVEAVEKVGRWLSLVGGATQTSAAERCRGWQWMEHETAASWPRFGAPADLFDRIIEVPGVLQHGDLWVGNVVRTGDGFGVVDWELARSAGIPLGDLAVFLPDALALIDGARSERSRLAHFVGLFRGELPASRVLFDLMVDAAAECGLETHHVGALVTIALLESGVPPWYDRHRLPVEAMPLRARFARAWLDEPGLGPSWPAWAASRP